jgi:hypothetical protein
MWTAQKIYAETSKDEREEICIGVKSTQFTRPCRAEPSQEHARAGGRYITLSVFTYRPTGARQSDDISQRQEHGDLSRELVREMAI